MVSGIQYILERPSIALSWTNMVIMSYAKVYSDLDEIDQGAR